MKNNILILSAIAMMGGTALGQSVEINTANSSIQWEGGNITGKLHNGHVALKSGALELRSGNITGGQFTIDMTTMTNADLPEGMGNKLMGHLKSDDFFSVGTYPNASLVIASATPFVDGQSTAKATLTIKGVSKQVSFDVSRNGQAYDAELVIDRAQFDVRYGSGSFFDNLGDDAILDEMTFTVHLEAKS
jgi:polyisoprenoid-binding protein YceI